MNEKEIFDKFVNNYSDIIDFLKNGGRNLIREEIKLMSYEDFQNQNVDSFKWYVKNYGEKHFVEFYKNRQKQDTKLLHFLDEVGNDVVSISNAREDSNIVHVWRVGTIYIKGVFSYDSYNGTDYENGSFYTVLPRKVEVVVWEEIDH